MTDPAPIRGRWTDGLRKRVMAFGGFQRTEQGEFWVSRDDVLRLLDEAPVPDEATIERGAQEVAKDRIPDDTAWEASTPGWTEADRRSCRDLALAVLRAALEAEA